MTAFGRGGGPPPHECLTSYEKFMISYTQPTVANRLETTAVQPSGRSAGPLRWHSRAAAQLDAERGTLGVLVPRQKRTKGLHRIADAKSERKAQRRTYLR